MIQDSEFSSFRDFSLGVQERRAQSKHGDQAIMIRAVQRQHVGSFLRLAWDPWIILFSSSATDIEERRIYFQEFTTGVHGIGFLEKQFSEELIKFLQYLISLLTDSIQEVTHVGSFWENIFEKRVVHFF